MQSTVPSSSSSIQDLNVELVKIFDNVKLTLNSTHICTWNQQLCFSYLSVSNAEHIFYELNQYMHDVSKKLVRIFCVIFKNCITNKNDAANTLYKIYENL